jgi:uncharacterized protein YodC (DUF2158 family)
MNQRPFKIGDYVRVKGTIEPIMSVNQLLENGQVACSWFDKNNHQVGGQFHEDQLVLVPQKQRE